MGYLMIGIAQLAIAFKGIFAKKTSAPIPNIPDSALANIQRMTNALLLSPVWIQRNNAAGG